MSILVKFSISSVSKFSISISGQECRILVHVGACLWACILCAFVRVRASRMCVCAGLQKAFCSFAFQHGPAAMVLRRVDAASGIMRCPL